MEISKPAIITLFVVLFATIIFFIILCLKIAGVFSDPIRSEELIKKELEGIADDCMAADFDGESAISKLFQDFLSPPGISLFETLFESLAEKEKFKDPEAAIRLLKLSLLTDELRMTMLYKCMSGPDPDCEIQLQDTEPFHVFATNLKRTVLGAFDLSLLDVNNPTKFFRVLEKMELNKDDISEERREIIKLLATKYTHILEEIDFYTQRILKKGKEKTAKVHNIL